MARSCHVMYGSTAWMDSRCNSQFFVHSAPINLCKMSIMLMYWTHKAEVLEEFFTDSALSLRLPLIFSKTSDEYASSAQIFQTLTFHRRCELHPSTNNCLQQQFQHCLSLQFHHSLNRSSQMLQCGMVEEH